MGQTDLGPSLGVYTPESATNSVHSIHGGSFNNMGDATTSNLTGQATNDTSHQVHASNVMESPNSISSVDMNSTPNAMQPMQQQQQQQQQQQSTQQYNQTQETMNAMQQQPPQQHMQQQQQQHVPQASPHNTMTAPSPAASVASNVHPPSIPSQSPHSNHNMTSP